MRTSKREQKEADALTAEAVSKLGELTTAVSKLAEVAKPLISLPSEGSIQSTGAFSALEGGSKMTEHELLDSSSGMRHGQ